MVSRSKGMPLAEVHTPEELLQGAEFFVDSDNPIMWRAAVLEAFSALETYLEGVVSATFERNAFPRLADWLKREMDDRWDKRLSLLASVAIRSPMDKQLSEDIDRAKRIRNLVTHQGKRVSASDARFVIHTAYKLLAYLGSTIEIELALLQLKKYVEDNNISITQEEDAVSVVRDYFGRTKAASTLGELPFKVITDSRHSAARGDLVLTFGTYRILVETKLIKASEVRHILGQRVRHHKDGSVTVRNPILKDLAEQIFGNLGFLNEIFAEAKLDLVLTQGVFVVFVERGGEIPSGFESVLKYNQGLVYTIVIKG